MTSEQYMQTAWVRVWVSMCAILSDLMLISGQFSLDQILVQFHLAGVRIGLGFCTGGVFFCFFFFTTQSLRPLPVHA